MVNLVGNSLYSLLRKAIINVFPNQEFPMIAPDPFCQYYAPLIENTYDVLDRIVVNAYFSLACGAGGFRYWWRQLHGTEETLDNTHLMRMAGRFSRRVRGWGEKHGVPVVYCAVGQRKHLAAEEYLPTDPKFRGIFLVLVSKMRAPVMEVLRFESGGFHVRRKKTMSFVNHYAFHIIDEEWGHVSIMICGHPPFKATVMLNGHEYVASQAKKARIAFCKEGNCFTEVSDPEALGRVADTLRSSDAVGQLRRVCERWIYQCVCFGLPFDDQKKSGFRYSYSIYQFEYSRNLLFHTGCHMDQVFEGMIDRTRAKLNFKKVKTIFGRRNRTWRRNGPKPRYERVVENPTYNMTVFKVHFERLTLKVYTKGEHVLRTEAIAHNVADLHCGKVIERFPQMIAKMVEMLSRFLEALRCVDIAWISDQFLEELPTPGVIGCTRIGGVDINKPRMRAAMESVLALALMPQGFTASEHAEKVCEIHGPANLYTPRQAAYDLKKLRAKGLVEKTGERSRRYRASVDGIRAMVALIVLREKVLKPLLRYGGRCKPGSKTAATAEIDAQYQIIQRQMQHLFKILKLAV
jgi:DNA-binding transcriptional ArsR family regulator